MENILWSGKQILENIDTRSYLIEGKNGEYSAEGKTDTEECIYTVKSIVFNIGMNRAEVENRF